MDFLELAKARCTSRGFTDEKISKIDLDRILSAGRVAPSACNRQPQRIIVVQDPENLTKVQKAYQTFGSQCVLVVCRDTRNELIRPFDQKCSGDLDIGIVCDHMLLAARELGIGSVMVGLFDLNIIRREFGIPEYIEPTALLILGYPEKGFLNPEHHSVERKPISQTVMYESCFMAKFEFEYTEIDGLLYPNIEIDGKAELDSLGKYGRLRLKYLHEQKAGMYRELLLKGKLAEHCAKLEKAAFEIAEQIHTAYLKTHPMPEEDTMERIRLSELAQEIADECVIHDLICQ